jgi:UDP-N-acetylmuramoylalanine--D-glutamate ligase
VNYQGKKIAVLGAGESGASAAVLLAEEGASVTLLDSAAPEKLRSKIEALAQPGITLLAGVAADSDPAVYDLGIISPGIDPATSLVRNFVKKQIDLIGELELSHELCACPSIAITGTNGKTTTTELVARMLNAAGVRTIPAGNIGPAFAAVVRKSPGLDFMTLEVSSFQLEEIRTFRPRVAVWLNLTPDHLDRYASMEEYRNAKLRVFENQTDEDFAVVNLRDELPALKAKRITFSATASGGDFELREGVIFFRGAPVLKMADTNLRGLHNAENLMAALGVGAALGLEFARLTPALCSYKPLPHRCELVGTVAGVDYVNDSKATNLDALEKALQSEQRPVVLIAGGKDKGFEFDSITPLVAEKVRRAVLIGEMTERIAGCWGGRVQCDRAGSLADAVGIARTNARAGDVVLFSPGTSSFDMFKNYADRGNQFRELIQKLASHENS